MNEITRRPRIKNKRILSERIEKFISPLYFADVNLYSKLYSHKQSAKSILHYHAPGRISFEEVQKSLDQFTETSLGQSFGPTWSTHWFKIDVDLSVESKWKGKEVHLRWNSNSEAMIWIDNDPKQGLTGGDGQTRTDYILTKLCTGTERFTVYIEMAANGMFGAGKDGMINTPDPNRTFCLSMVEIAAIDRNIYSIINDLKIIIDMAQNLDEDSDVGWHALQIGCDVVNCFQPIKEDSILRAKEILDKFFKDEGSNPAGPNAYNVHAIGHCHIDTAWLWPYAETERKCARSWSSVIGLMERYPEFKFACSQAVQFQWVKTKYPSLYQKIKKYALKNQFLPTGGTWVEMDGNIPSGESFMRQFLYGQHFFKKEFGHICDVFWLPDTFGYSSQLPQIIRQSGIKYFLTQKISWSLVNKFPHNSFQWQGIDGTKCLTHFPPADTYESSVTFKDVLKTRDQNKDKGVVSDGMLLFGYGDGGGGPTEDMIENVNRMGNISGLPRIEHSDPTKFFNTLEHTAHLLHTWVGELYLELHQGTFTSQALIKKRNRQCEFLLRNTELYNTWALLKSPGAKLASTSCVSDEWKKVLLNQFHDVLPGTSIKQVYDDAENIYKEVIKNCTSILSDCYKVLFNLDDETVTKNTVLLNSNSWKRHEVVVVDNKYKFSSSIKKQPLHGATSSAILVNVPSIGFCSLGEDVESSDHVAIHQDSTSQTITLENNQLLAVFNQYGHVTSCLLKKNKRECISADCHGNIFTMFTDIPLFWDAWDVMPYNEETREVIQECTSMRILDQGPLRVSFEVSLKLSDRSTLTQVISLDACADYIRFDTQVNWYENRRLLKVEFPFNVHTEYATYEVQCGHLRRPTHGNTSWDWAKQEVCGHKWVDVSEYDFGVAVLNDCKYGFSAYGSTLQMSLLRSPKAPDDEADMGKHSFSYAVFPHVGSFQAANVIRRAYDFNNPIVPVSTCNSVPSTSFLKIDNPAVIIEAVKMAEEDNDHMIIRLYESFGSQSKATLTSHFPFKQFFRVNILEDKADKEDNDLCFINEHQYSFSMKPFEILTLCFTI